MFAKTVMVTADGGEKAMMERLAIPVPDRPPGISASHAAGILVKRPENRSEEEIRTLLRLKKVHHITERCCTLLEEFAGMRW